MRNILYKVPILAACGLAAVHTKAGTATFDLNTPPSNEFVLVGSAEYEATGGVNNSGFIKLTDNTGQSCAVLFPDFDKGLVVAAFTFECDIKLGDWYGNAPADGFSVNYARADDPIVALIESGENPGRGSTADGWAGEFDNGGTADDLPEEGTKTGIGIGFDTWGTGTAPVGGSNGPNDVRGISVRVDGKQQTQVAMPNVLFPDNYDYLSDATTLITGPFTNGADPNNANFGNPDNGDGTTAPPALGTKLKWAHLKLTVDANGTLNVFWKGQNIVKDLATSYGPGPGRIIFGASTGGAMEFAGVDNISITTVPSDKAIVSTATAFAKANGFSVTINDSGASIVDPDPTKSKLVVKFNGAAITPTITKTNTTLTASYTLPAGQKLGPGSTNTVDVSAVDARGVAITGSKTFLAPSYVDIPATFAVTGVDKTKPGFNVRVHKMFHGAVNRVYRAEQEMFGELGKNVADLTQTGFTGDLFIEPTVINYDATSDSGNNGHITPDTRMPGFPSLEPYNSTDFNAAEITTFIEFPAPGMYLMDVNSDDGFATYVGKNPKDRFQLGSLLVGQFIGGRGASDSIMPIYINQAGIYPFRTVWENGGGGANIEWTMQNDDGTYSAINDSADAKALKAYQKGPLTDRAYISKISPGVGYVLGTPGTPLTITIVDATTKATNAKLKVNGNDVTASATINANAGTTTISYGQIHLGETWNVELTYDESGGNGTRDVTFSFTPFLKVDMDEINGTGAFWIEAEDFNYGGGKTQAAASTMPYAGGAYADLDANPGIDYNGNDPQDSTDYRHGPNLGDKGATPPITNTQGVDINSRGTARWAVDRPGSPGVITTDYGIGWADGADWMNYTRTVPAGVYRVYAAHSYDNSGGDMSPGQIHATLSKVTSSASAGNQTLQPLGVFDAPGSAAWGPNDLVAMQNPQGNIAYVKINSGDTTFRYNLNSGDFDWFVLEKPSNSVPPQIISFSPLGDVPRASYAGSIPSNGAIDVQISDMTTTVDTNKIKLTVDNTDVTPTITKSGDVTTVHYAPGFKVGQHAFSLSITDSGGATQTLAKTFTANPLGTPGQFLIEAEDFDYDGGKTKAEASTMPYTGGAYKGLGAVIGVDYNNDDGKDSSDYRDVGPAGTHVNINDNGGDSNRGSWTMTSNYKIGWVGDPDWQNYTRTVPKGDYNIYGSLSYDDLGGAHRLKGDMQLVSGGAGTTNQTYTTLGSFDAPGTGGWGVNNLVPLMDASGGIAKVSFDGTQQTLHYVAHSADTDFFVLVPASGTVTPPPGPKALISITGNTIKIDSDSGGTVQGTSSLASPITWTDIGPAPQTVTISGAGFKFYRIKK